MKIHHKISLILVFSVIFFFIELITGVIINSITLQASSLHRLSDIITNIIALLCEVMVLKDKNLYATYGYTRYKILGGLVNSIFLMALCVHIFIEVFHTFMDMGDVKDTLAENINLQIYIGIGELFLNILGIILFYSQYKRNENLNIKALYIHYLGDTLSSINIIASGLLIKYLSGDNKYYSEPICAMIIIIIILCYAIPLFRRTFHIFLQQTPKHINNDEIITELKNLDNVLNIHKFHVWNLDNNTIIGTLHYTTNSTVNFENTIVQIKHIMHQHGIHLSTIQPELQNEENCNEPICSIICNTDHTL